MYAESTAYIAEASEVILISKLLLLETSIKGYFREDPKLDWATLIQTDRQQVLQFFLHQITNNS